MFREGPNNNNESSGFREKQKNKGSIEEKESNTCSKKLGRTPNICISDS